MSDVDESASGFARCEDGPCFHWECYPDGEAAHAALLDRLTAMVDGMFLAPPQEMTVSQKGNLGEFIAFYVGNRCAELADFRVHPANALKPLNPISRPELDLVWVRFGEREEDDRMVLQEVKTTSTNDLGLAYDLTGDYRKLFGRDIQLTLRARLTAIKMELEFFVGQPALARRLSRFVASAPSRSRDTLIVPTLVFDDQVAPRARAGDRLLAVRTRLIGDGWRARDVVPWSVALSDLDQRLLRLARGG